LNPLLYDARRTESFVLGSAAHKLTVLMAALILNSQVCLAQTCEYTIEKVGYKNLVANLYMPKIVVNPSVVIAFGGSEGGISAGNSTGEMLAPHCIAVLGIAFFKEQGLSPTLDQIPLEYFFDAVDFVSQFKGIDGKRIGMVSGSRGSEAALLIASMDPRIKSLVVATPSEVAWYGRTKSKSAWTYRGEDIPALTPEDDVTIPQVKRFENTLNSVQDWDLYRFHVDLINGPIFLISAKNDEIWPSKRMSDDLVRYLKAHNFKYRVKHDSYATGHGFSKEAAPAIKRSVVDWFLETL